MMANNDPAESPFASLTHQLQSFGQLLGIHASALGHARVNGDFHWDFNNSSLDGAYHWLSANMHHSLLHYALAVAPAVHKSEQTAIDKQHATKKLKQDLLCQNKMVLVQMNMPMH